MRNPRAHDTRTCPNCGGHLTIALVDLEDEMLICVESGCGWEEGDEDLSSYTYSIAERRYVARKENGLTMEFLQKAPYRIDKS